MAETPLHSSRLPPFERPCELFARELSPSGLALEGSMLWYATSQEQGVANEAARRQGAQFRIDFPTKMDYFSLVGHRFWSFPVIHLTINNVREF